ncbi:hypothetical protein ACOACO_16750 [Nocardioides sp. CPCC 205120]|uniref:hypothetical protein n=1 Tax=Nocardioides sp. CPCC 205120 TaxID=3406462 RepID=UPI003B501EF0
MVGLRPAGSRPPTALERLNRQITEVAVLSTPDPGTVLEMAFIGAHERELAFSVLRTRGSLQDE